MGKPLITLLILGALTACGGTGDEDATPIPKADAEPVSPPIDPATAATLTGSVSLEGAPPEQEIISMAADPTCAGMHETEVQTEHAVINEDGSLRNAFVYIKEGLAGYTFSPPAKPVVLEQKGCIFVPHVLGVMTGQALDIVNRDGTLHNVHVSPRENPPFNIGQPGKGAKKTKTFGIPEVMIPIKCDVHKWMKAYLGVLEHPYYHVTRDGGRFELPHLPPGDYVVEAWHETFGTRTQNVTLGEKESKEITFTFTSSN
jgi:plastocyanin